MALNQEDVLAFIDMIEKRKEQVIEANGVSQESNPSQYQWLNGIYDDIIGLIKSQY